MFFLQFYKTLEQCLLAAKCGVGLQLGDAPCPVLGISAEHLKRAMPSEQVSPGSQEVHYDILHGFSMVYFLSQTGAISVGSGCCLSAEV